MFENVLLESCLDHVLCPYLKFLNYFSDWQLFWSGYTRNWARILFWFEGTKFWSQNSKSSQAGQHSSQKEKIVREYVPLKKLKVFGRVLRKTRFYKTFLFYKADAVGQI